MGRRRGRRPHRRAVFPVDGRPVADWTKQIATLPFPLRGDRTELPELGWRTARRTRRPRTTSSVSSGRRARNAACSRSAASPTSPSPGPATCCCARATGGTSARRRARPFAVPDELHGSARTVAGQVAVWADTPADDAPTRWSRPGRRRPWPFDPLGDRRPAPRATAPPLVRAACRRPAPPARPERRSRVETWDAELELLLRRAAPGATARRRSAAVELPVAAVGLASWSCCAATRPSWPGSLRRPLPRRPAPTGPPGNARSTLWLEARWGQQRLLDVDELPGAADETRRARRRPGRPAGGVQRQRVGRPRPGRGGGAVRHGRRRRCCCAAGCDAVFTDAPDGGSTSSTGRPGRRKSGPDATAAAVQLAVYRLAWHHLTGVPLERIRRRLPPRRGERDGAPGRPARRGRPDRPGPLGAASTRRAGPAIMKICTRTCGYGSS